MPTRPISSTARARAALRDIPSRTSGSSAIWSPTRITGLSAVIGSWKIIETVVPRSSLRRSSPAAVTSTPSISIVPPVSFAPRGSRPTSARRVTVFPEPDSPTRPSASPGSTSNETPSTACTAPRARSELDPKVAHLHERLAGHSGLSRSASPSASSDSPSAVKTTATPGNVESCQCVVRYVWPLAIMFPQSGVGGCTPRPR